MNTTMETASVNTPMAQTYRKAKTKKNTYLYLLASWFLLIAIGALGAKLYTDHLKQQISESIAQQTQAQLQVVQEDYQKQVSQLKDNISADMSKLQGKIDSLNELLAFTKDSANSKTDNSNQLYSQLAEVKKKLDDLKKNLDVLQ